MKVAIHVAIPIRYASSLILLNILPLIKIWMVQINIFLSDLDIHVCIVLCIINYNVHKRTVLGRYYTVAKVIIIRYHSMLLFFNISLLDTLQT